MIAFRASPFFYPGPRLLPPILDRLGILFAGAALGLLARPTQRTENLPDVRGMILDLELILDHLGHARAGPKVRVEPGMLGTEDQKSFEPP
jgi:hypothetical protein